MTESVDREHTITVPTVIPIFPLSDVVLLPGEVLPLHIFEPRYRAMVRDALAGHQMIGMVEVDAAGKAASVGQPPVERVGCLGIIGRHQRLDDGRYLLWLFGLERFSIESELEVETPYRQAVVAYTNFAEGPAELARLQPLVEDLRRLIPALVEGDDATRRKIADEIADVDAPQLLPLACRIVEMPAARKRQVLEAPSLAESFLLVYRDVNDALALGAEPLPGERGSLN